MTKLKDPALRARFEAAWADFKAIDPCAPDARFEIRRQQLGLDPDIDQRDLALRILSGDELEKHERLFVARLLDPALAEKIKPEPKKKRVRWAAAIAIQADVVLERYFEYRALHPKAKHKEDALPALAKRYRVSHSYIDAALKKQKPKRRAEMEKRAAAFAKAYTLFVEDCAVNGLGRFILDQADPSFLYSRERG